MKRTEFEAQLIQNAFEKIESNMEWGLQRIKELHDEPERVVDQVYGFNMGGNSSDARAVLYPILR